ncbi:MAG: F0F1 ATP synthase subunit C [Alphaproteobacteria bacterium]|nr:F0F1 ATP synthase subunit C [Alphaproteobacteria bacterium]MBP7757652.1 F0F1 ATP synthase subunit C [Alphaproteobacteria bacterium]MBP7761148.1 F0F1 ATP synthase subunit C [Alphaproteobacteria bacterium]MBP7905169.1 F0F1 ATP synthase subunit C [Alphaproteobacteria bacterium]
MEVEVAKLIAGALVTIPAFGAALGLGMYFKSYNDALARNPETKGALDEKYFLSLAFIEALGIIPIGIGAALLFA